MMGHSAGFTFSYVGGDGRTGRTPPAAEIMELTSCAAASMGRFRENCRVMDVDPWLLVDVMDSRPWIVANFFSRGVATVTAIVSGEAPGRFAVTWMVG